MSKTFVLDTNVLLHNAEAISSFGENTVILPMQVIEELDKFKSRNDELGRNARQVIRSLDNFRDKGRLGEGVSMDGGGVLKIMSGKMDVDDSILETNGIPDNKIIRTAFALHQKGDNVIFVSKDINARIKADAVGLVVTDFEKQKVNFDELYSGYREIEVPEGIITDFFEESLEGLEEYGLFPNEFVLLVDIANPKHTALTRVSQNKKLMHLTPQYEKAWNVKFRSKEQRMALELLMDPVVQVVTLVGKAGTGKTLLALSAALQSTVKLHRYDKILVSRPIVPMGKDIGYLPGDKEEKLSHWMEPIFDNLNYLMRGNSSKNKEGVSTWKKVDNLLHNDIIELEALTYIRGRSIPQQYMIVDEAQNLTPHEVKTIVSRAGEGTKVVLTGDPYQIDNPYLDASSNGLTYTAERLKEEAIHGHITLTKSERSAVAAVAANRL